MALSAQTYQGDGSNTDFVLDFTLGYISESHIHVYVDDAEIPQNTLQFILGGGSVRLPTAPASGSEVLVRRIVPNDKLLHDYENGSLVIESNLDESNLQSIMLQHEAVDGFSTGIYGDINFFTEISDSPEDTAESPRGVEQVTITGLASLAAVQRGEFEDTFNDQHEQFETTFNSQFTYKRIGNISDYVGQSLPAYDKLNSYQYPDDSGNWYAPIQGQPFPITIPSDPSVASIGWVLTASPNIYRGLWPDTGGSAYKGDTYQTQVSGTPTGQYFTALQNTTVDPVGDDVNWREVVSVDSFSRYTDIVYKASGGKSAVENMIAGTSTTGVKASSGGTIWVHNGGTSGSISDFDAKSVILADDFNTGTTPEDLTSAIQAALDYAKDTGNSVEIFGRKEISGTLTVACPFNLNGGMLSQNDATSDTVKVQFGSYIRNGTILTNNSTGIGLEVDGSSEIFIGRVKPTKLFTSLLVIGNETNQGVGSSKGIGVQLSALDANSYISGASGDAQVGLFTTGVKVVAAVEAAFINSNNFEFGINRCLDHYVSEGVFNPQGCNIGPDNYWHLNIQPGDDAATVLKLFEQGDNFTGTLWDLAGIPDVNNAIVLDNSRPPAPNNNIIPVSGNVIDMIGASIDKATGPVFANEFVPRVNTTNNKAAMSYTQGTGHNYYPRIFRNSTEGVYDTLNYLSAVDNCITGADKRYLLITTEGNQWGSGATSVSPVSGFYVKDMFIASGDVTRYETAPGNWLQVAISFKEGDVPIGNILADVAGIAGNVGTDIYIEIREVGQSAWTEARFIQGKDNGRTYMSRFNPWGGSVNQIRSAAIDGLRFRMFNADGVYEIQNIFVMSPTLLGKESVNPNEAEIHTGNLDMGFSSDQGIIMNSPDGNRYKVVMKNGGVLNVEGPI